MSSLRGIKFSIYLFTEPEPLTSWQAPPRAGVYVILIPNGSYNPRPFQPIYFGESGDMSTRGFLNLHHKCGDWRRVARDDKNLFVAAHSMPTSTPEQRRAVESELVGLYSPVCNG
jgi:hypothetical protein